MKASHISAPHRSPGSQQKADNVELKQELPAKGVAGRLFVAGCGDPQPAALGESPGANFCLKPSAKLAV